MGIYKFVGIIKVKGVQKEPRSNCRLSKCKEGSLLCDGRESPDVDGLMSLREARKSSCEDEK